jgi:hypothetical protein
MAWKIYKCVDLNVIDQLLIRYCAFVRLEKEWECNVTVHQVFIDFEKAYDSVRRELLYNILTEFSVLIKLIRLIRMSLNETYSKFRVRKINRIHFLFRMVWRKEMMYSHCFSTLLKMCHQEGSRDSGRIQLNGTYRRMICADDVKHKYRKEKKTLVKS